MQVQVKIVLAKVNDNIMLQCVLAIILANNLPHYSNGYIARVETSIYQEMVGDKHNPPCSDFMPIHGALNSFGWCASHIALLYLKFFKHIADRFIIHNSGGGGTSEKHRNYVQ